MHANLSSSGLRRPLKNRLRLGVRLAICDSLSLGHYEINEWFQQKVGDLKAASALHFAYYNFCRVHSSIRCTPAMEAGISKHVWTLNDLLTA